MLDQSDGSVLTVQRALFRPWMTLQDQQLAEEESADRSPERRCLVWCFGSVP
jgi:hypothetical protein